MTMYSALVKRENVFLKYEAIFEDSLRKAETTASEASYPPVKFSFLDNKALSSWSKEWPPLGKGDNDSVFDWKRLLDRKRTAKYFAIAVWDDRDLLFGVFYGKVSYRSNLVSISYIESNKSYSGSLKGLAALLATLVTMEIAINVNAKRIAILKPVNEKVEKHYIGLGYKKGSFYGIKRAVFMVVPDMSDS